MLSQDARVHERNESLADCEESVLEAGERSVAGWKSPLQRDVICFPQFLSEDAHVDQDQTKLCSMNSNIFCHYALTVMLS